MDIFKIEQESKVFQMNVLISNEFVCYMIINFEVKNIIIFVY